MTSFPLLLVLLPILFPFATLEVIGVARNAGAVWEKRHGLRLHGPPGLLADSSGHRTDANKPSVGNIDYPHLLEGARGVKAFMHVSTTASATAYRLIELAASASLSRSLVIERCLLEVVKAGRCTTGLRKAVLICTLLEEL